MHFAKSLCAMAILAGTSSPVMGAMTPTQIVDTVQALTNSAQAFNNLADTVTASNADASTETIVNSIDALSEQFNVDGVALQGNTQLPTSAIPSANVTATALITQTGIVVYDTLGVFANVNVTAQLQIYQEQVQLAIDQLNNTSSSFYTLLMGTGLLRNLST